jgi:hypothetical protein
VGGGEMMVSGSRTETRRHHMGGCLELGGPVPLVRRVRLYHGARPWPATAQSFQPLIRRCGSCQPGAGPAVRVEPHLVRASSSHPTDSSSTRSATWGTETVEGRRRVEATSTKALGLLEVDVVGWGTSARRGSSRGKVSSTNLPIRPNPGRAAAFAITGCCGTPEPQLF